jgi:conjugal transfer/type IV secretion protein DotA/TraY
MKGLRFGWLLAVLILLQTTDTFAQSSENPDDTVQVDTTAIELSVRQAQELAESLNLPDGFADGARSDDVFYQMLKKIIGQPLADITAYTGIVDPSAGVGSDGKGVTVMTWLISIMAGVGLVATSVAAMFILVVGLARTNLSGSFGGKSGGSAAGFLVMRTGAASILNIPLPQAGGLALSQVMMLVIALIGIGAGSAVFREASSRMLTQPLIAYAHPSSEKLFMDAVKARMCLSYRIYHGYTDEEFETKGWHQGSWTDSIKSADDAFKGLVLRWFSDEETSFDSQFLLYGDDGICGRVTIDIPQSEPSSIGASVAQNVIAIKTLLDLSSTGGGDQIEVFIKGQMNVALINAFRGLHSDASLKKAIDDILEKQYALGETIEIPESVIPAIASSYNKFQSTINDALVSTLGSFQCSNAGGDEDSRFRAGCENNKKLTENISKRGFALAGSYTWVLAERQTMLVDAIDDATDIEFALDWDDVLTNGDILESEVASDSYANMFLVMEQAFKNMSQTRSDDLSSALNQSYELSTQDGPIMEAMGDAVKNSWRGMIKLATGAGGDWENPEPLIMMRSIGNTMINIPIILAGLDIATSFIPATKVAGLAKGASKSMSKISLKRDRKSNLEQNAGGIMSYMLRTVVNALFYIGIFLAIVVPAIPMVMWNTAIVGFFLYVLMIVIGTPIMIAAKSMDTGEEGLMGAAKTGYYMAFNLFLRPTLMVVGLILAMATSRVLSWFWNATFFETFQMTQSGSGSIATLIGYPMIWGAGMMVIIYKSYGLVNDVSATVMKMFGAEGHHSSFGEEQDRDKLFGVMSNTTTQLAAPITHGKTKGGMPGGPAKGKESVSPDE